MENESGFDLSYAVIKKCPSCDGKMQVDGFSFFDWIDEKTEDGLIVRGRIRIVHLCEQCGNRITTRTGLDVEEFDMTDRLKQQIHASMLQRRMK